MLSLPLSLMPVRLKAAGALTAFIVAAAVDIAAVQDPFTTAQKWGAAIVLAYAVFSATRGTLLFPLDLLFELFYNRHVTRNGDRVRSRLDLLYADRIKAQEARELRLSATEDRMEAYEQIIKQQGRSLAEQAEALKVLPQLDKTFGRFADTLDVIGRTMEKLEKKVDAHGNDISHMRGIWDGIERRRSERRERGEDEESYWRDGGTNRRHPPAERRSHTEDDTA